jgi:broad specificity phosphatase PhoE
MLLLPDANGATRLVLVRHAATEESARGRCHGRTDVPLSREGRAQAAALAGGLRGLALTAVYTSPLSRALDTARPIAAEAGLAPVTVVELEELDFGGLEGVAYEQIEAEHPDLFRRWLDGGGGVRFPGGESLAELQERVLSAVAEIRARHEAQSVAVVAHGGVLRVVLGDALGLADEALFRIDQAHCGVSVVDWLAGVPLVRVVNVGLGLPA